MALFSRKTGGRRVQGVSVGLCFLFVRKKVEIRLMCNVKSKSLHASGRRAKGSKEHGHRAAEHCRKHTRGCGRILYSILPVVCGPALLGICCVASPFPGILCIPAAAGAHPFFVPFLPHSGHAHRRVGSLAAAHRFPFPC